MQDSVCSRLDWLLLNCRICGVYHFAKEQTSHTLPEHWAGLVWQSSSILSGCSLLILIFEHFGSWTWWLWRGELIKLTGAVPGQSLCPVVHTDLLSVVCWLIHRWCNKMKKLPNLLHWAGVSWWLIKPQSCRWLENEKKLDLVPKSLLKHPARCWDVWIFNFLSSFATSIQFLGLAWLPFCNWFGWGGIPPAEILDALPVICFYDKFMPPFELAVLYQKGQRGSWLSRFLISCRTCCAS